VNTLLKYTVAVSKNGAKIPLFNSSEGNIKIEAIKLIKLMKMIIRRKIDFSRKTI